MDVVFDALHETVTRKPGSLALASPSGYMAYDDFLGNILSVASAVARHKIEPGQLVVVAAANPDALLIIALALLRIGCRVGYNRDTSLYDDGGVAIDAVISDAAIPGVKQRVVTIGRDWFRGAAGLGIDLPPPASEYSVIFSSSGSTGRPKLIECESKVLLHRISNRLRDPDLGDAPHFLSAMGNRTAGHFTNAMVTFSRGGTLIGLNERNGASVVNAINLFWPDYVIMSPSMLADVLRHLDEKPSAIDKVAILRTAGSACAPELQRTALDRIAEEFISYYGSTETGGIAWGYSRDVVTMDGCVGRIVEGIHAAAFDADNRRLPPGQEGKIRVKLPEGAAGAYIGNYAEEPSAFKDGWFATGDIGMVDADRNLIIRGRHTNVINVGGSKISPEELEEQIRAFSQVKDIGVCGLVRPEGFEQICAAIVTTSKLTVDDVNTYLYRRGGRWPVDLVKIVPAIPRTESGKIDREALQRLCSEQT